MLRTLFSGILAIAAVAVLAQTLLADGERKPTPNPGPESFFKRLDANQDRQITEDEIPESVPDRFEAMLRRADTNGDKRITAEELTAAVKEHRAGPPRAGERPTRRPTPSAGRGGSRPGRPPFAGRSGDPRAHGPMHARMAGPGRGRPPSQARGPSRGMPDPKILFSRLDKNRDEKLSLEEFAEGMKAVHGRGRPPFAGRGGPPAMGRRFGPPPAMASRGPGFLAGERFKRADANDDGKITPDEVPSTRREHFERMLARVDKDGDKALNAEEARRAAAAMMGHVRLAMAQRRADPRRAAAVQRFAAAARERSARSRAAAAVRESGDTRRKPAEPGTAAPKRRKPAQPRMSPEARKKALEARKKKAEAARAAAAEKRKARAKKTADPEARKKAGEARKKQLAEAKKEAAEANNKEAPPAERPDSKE